jgi:LCP family protein required for cell wall assembly
VSEIVPTQNPESNLSRAYRPAIYPTDNPSSTPIPIPTSIPTSTYPWKDFPGPVEDSEMVIPGPVDPIDFHSNTVNILLLGSDRRPKWKWYQTDAIMIASLDLDSDKVTLISIPRDLYVYIPGWRVNRINTAEYRGGFEMIANTILYNLGIPVHHWIRVEYWGFSEAVDVLDGIDVLTTRRLKSMCEGVPYEYEPGVEYHMDGFAAMCYVRMRLNSSDFDRLRRQEEITRALFDKAISIDGLLKIPQLYDTFNEYVESDLTLGDILPMIPLATKLTLDPSHIRFYRIDNTMVQNWRTPQTRQAVLLPNQELVQKMLEEAFGVP